MKIPVLDFQSEDPRFMIKEKFIIDQLTSTNANLVDQIGRMQTHIENLWEEVGFKNEKINDLIISLAGK